MFANLQLREFAISANGAKTAQLLNEKNEHLTIVLDEPVYSPFGASSWSNDPKATRYTIELSLYPEQVVQWRKFNDWAVGYLAQESERLLKKQLTPEQMLEMYNSPLHEREGYAPTLRCKISLGQSQHACKFWNSAHEQIAEPETLKGTPSAPV